MSSSLLLQRYPACFIRQTWMVSEMWGKWPYGWCFVGCCFQDFLQICIYIFIYTLCIFIYVVCVYVHIYIYIYTHYNIYIYMYIYIHIYIYIYVHIGGIHGVMVTVIGNGHSNQVQILDKAVYILQRTNTFTKKINPTILFPAIVDWTL